MINLAAKHRDDAEPKSLYDAVNVDSIENVCKLCAEVGIKNYLYR